MKRRIKNAGRHARKKGHQFERDVAIAFRVLFPEASRQLEYQMRDCKGVDLAHTGFFKIQCKRFRKYANPSRIQEIECDEAFGDIPVLITAGDGLRPLAVLPMEYLIDLIREARGAWP